MHVLKEMFHFQKIISSYYDAEFTYKDLVKELTSSKECGDEFTLMLASKWLHKNITVITSKRDWSVYENCQPNVVVTYKGKDRYMRGKWASSQLATRIPSSNK